MRILRVNEHDYDGTGIHTCVRDDSQNSTLSWSSISIFSITICLISPLYPYQA